LIIKYLIFLFYIRLTRLQRAAKGTGIRASSNNTTPSDEQELY